MQTANDQATNVRLSVSPQSGMGSPPTDDESHEADLSWGGEVCEGS